MQFLSSSCRSPTRSKACGSDPVGASIEGLSQYFIVLGTFAVVLTPLSLLAFALAVRRTRVTGTLGQY